LSAFGIKVRKEIAKIPYGYHKTHMKMLILESAENAKKFTQKVMG
jgi:hypothetical protein